MYCTKMFRFQNSRLVPTSSIISRNIAPLMKIQNHSLPSILRGNNSNFVSGFVKPSSILFAPRAASVDEAIEKNEHQKQTTTKLAEPIGAAANTNASNSDQKNANEPLWPNCDTIEEIMDEEKFGPEGEEDKQPPVQPEHIVLAFRAFVWGTFWAVAGVGAISLFAMKYCGFTNIGEVLHYVGNKDKRIIEEMRAQGVEVIEYEVDLTNPGTVPDQISLVWSHILEASGVAAELEKAVNEAAMEGEEKKDDQESNKEK